MKSKILIIIFITTLFLTGCDGNITRDIRESGFNVSDKSFKCELLINKKSQYTLDKPQYLVNNLIITEKGQLLEISLDKQYLNNMNCKKVSTNIEVVSIFSDEIVKSKDNKYYYIKENQNIIPYTEATINDSKYNLYNTLLQDSNVIKVQSVNGNANSYYVLKTDGKIYNYILEENTSTKTYNLVSALPVDLGIFIEDKIIDFNYKGKSSATFYKTKTSIYSFKNTNMKECNKYADVKCEYKLEKNNTLTMNKDRIKVYNGTQIITDYGRVFSLNS